MLELSRDGLVPSGTDTGAAWLSSARVVRCWVKSVTSATLVLGYQHLGGHSKETAGDKPEEGGDDAVIMALTARATRATMVARVAKPRGGANPIKPIVVRISLQLTREVGIASNRESECHGEYVPGPCTHRPSHHGSGLLQK